MTIVDEIVAIADELRPLTQRDPDALARRDEILATKAELVERVAAQEAQR